MRYAFDRRPAETAGALRLASRFGLVVHAVRLLRSMYEGEAGQARVMQGLEVLVSPIRAALKDSGSPCGGIGFCRIARTHGRRETCAVTPQTRYARTADGVHIAYQVHGDGPIDLVIALGDDQRRGVVGGAVAGAFPQPIGLVVAPDPIRQAGRWAVGPGSGVRAPESGDTDG